MIDKIEDTIMVLSKNVKVKLVISLNQSDKKYPAFKKDPYSKTKNSYIMRVNPSEYLVIEYLEFFYDSGNNCKPKKSEVFISHPNWYPFIKGLQDTVKMLNQVIEYNEDNIPFIAIENKKKYIKIENLAIGKALVLLPCVKENEDDPEKEDIGVNILLNGTDYISFISYDTFLSFCSIMGKFDLYQASRACITTSLTYNSLYFN
jgi:hypothetical protein